MNDLAVKFMSLVFASLVLFYFARYGSTFDTLFQTGFRGTSGLISTLQGQPPFQVYGATTTPRRAINVPVGNAQLAYEPF